MNSMLLKSLLFGPVLFAVASNLLAEPVTVSVKATQPGAAISANTLGVSYETSLMLPDTNGVHYFRPDNKPLVNIFRTLGIESLRIGGNSVDAPNVPVPSEADITAFLEFARAAGVKVIYSVRLEEPRALTITNAGATASVGSIANARSAAKIAGLIHDRFADVLDSFAIGNEPDYFRDYAIYRVKWAAIHDAMVTTYPRARFSGPDQNPSPALDKNLVRDYANDAGNLVMITQHNYPFGCAYRNPQSRSDISKLIPFDAAQSREKMLSPAAYRSYESMRQGIANAISGTSLSYRLTEANSFWFSGLKDASDSYASALWSIDYLYWWAEHGADGINFHTGDRTGGDLSMICRYAAFVTATNGYEVRPLGYGMKLFDLGSHGRQLPAVSSGSNLVVYATLENQTIAVTLINKDHGPEAQNQTVQIKLDVPQVDSTQQVVFLTAKGNNIGGGFGDVTLGGALIEEDGAWKGHPTRLPSSAAGGNTVTIEMPPASAAVVQTSIR